MTRTWSQRPLEERALFNPAFMARIVRAAAEGYSREATEGLPFPLAFLVPPIVLHRPTRVALPRAITTNLLVWLDQNAYLRQTFPARARAVLGAGREGLVVGLASGLISRERARIVAPPLPRRKPGLFSTSQTEEILARALFVGRWFARSGDVATIYAQWGVKP